MIMRMKILLVVFFLCGAATAEAQELIFCEKVDAKGNPILKSKSFEIGQEGSFLFLLTKLPRPVNAGKVIYDIYKLDSLNKEELESSYSRVVNPAWTWFKNGFTFYHPGHYAVYIYDESERLLVSGRLELIAAKPGR